MDFETIKLDIPEGCNLILGMSHFIKTVEDVHEVMVNSIPNAKFGVAFCEASMDRLIRFSGTDDELTKTAIDNIAKVGAGHSFLLVMRDSFPINVLPALKNVVEIVRLFCATANPVEVIIAKTEQGSGIIGVVDGQSPLGVEDDAAKEKRHQFLRQIGYKK